jgi:cation diffusion facilitator family transporter
VGRQDEAHQLTGASIMMSTADRASLTRFAWLSIAAAVATMALKTVAYVLTGSVGLLSDALESIVNLVGAVLALTMLAIAARPADEDHAFGHGKAEYFSSGVEGGLIVVAALSIAGAAIERLLRPRALEYIGIGVTVSVVASLVNLGAALVLARAGRRHHSISLEANARHLMTDVWTSAGVIVALGAVAATGWQWLDPAVALAVAANIVWSGMQIVGRSVAGLMDKALLPEEQAAVRRVLERHITGGLQYHALRTRQAGARRFVYVHVLVPGDWTVHRGHQLLEAVEADIRSAVPNTTVLTHLESLDDPSSWDDEALDRAERA